MGKDTRHTRTGLGWLVSEAPSAPRAGRSAAPSSRPPRDFFSKPTAAGNPYVSERPTDPVKGRGSGRPGMLRVPPAARVPSDLPVPSPLRNHGLGTISAAPRSELPRPGWQLSEAPANDVPRGPTSSVPAPRRKRKRRSAPPAQAKTKRPTGAPRPASRTAPPQFVDGWDQVGFWASVFAWFLCAAAFVFVDAAAPQTWQTRNTTFLDQMFGVKRRLLWDMALVHWAQLFWFLSALGASVGLLIKSTASRGRGAPLPRSLIALCFIAVVSLLASFAI